ncbi:uncharacterized protein BJX67DRAFT_334960 [Aspergillus lucknowensis]|uniref:C2H2-type domain-containing protein n=1 Tax=Aspergillus lucknowensis TaxID=176173 RepID=A0ABR4L6A2_9EURO
MSTSSLQREYNTLKQIIKNSTIRLVCPICLRGFPRSDKLYDHFREKEDETHQGLNMRNSDFSTFLFCYQESLGDHYIPPERITLGSECFDIFFVIENYRKDPRGRSTK